MDVLPGARLVHHQREQLCLRGELLSAVHGDVLLAAVLGGLQRAVDDLLDLGVADGLEDVVEHGELDGPAGVLELIVAGDDDDLAVGHGGAHVLEHLKTVQLGHADVQQQDVRAHAQHERLAALPIEGGARDCAAAGGPVDRLREGTHGDGVVVDDDHLGLHAAHSFPVRRAKKGTNHPDKSFVHYIKFGARCQQGLYI